MGVLPAPIAGLLGTADTCVESLAQSLLPHGCAINEAVTVITSRACGVSLGDLNSHRLLWPHGQELLVLHALQPVQQPVLSLSSDALRPQSVTAIRHTASWGSAVPVSQGYSRQGV